MIFKIIIYSSKYKLIFILGQNQYFILKQKDLNNINKKKQKIKNNLIKDFKIFLLIMKNKHLLIKRIVIILIQKDLSMNNNKKE